MKRSRLSHQIALSISVVAVIAILLDWIGFIGFYAIMWTLWPPPPAQNLTLQDLVPQGKDYAFIGLVIVLSLMLALVFALRLTSRIIAPLNSLAEGARRIAAGDLSARALPGDRPFGETAQLVDDFNAMAQRLEDTAKAMVSWNAAIAHELRTPLTILRGRLQGVTDDVFEPSGELFRNLLSQVEALSRLVEDLRVVTLSDSGRLEMRFESTDLEQEVRQAVDAMRPGLTDAGFKIELATRPAFLLCDGVRLRQALLALLENARRYATPGLLQVSMRVDSDGLVIAVEDQGPGLSPDFAPHAFDAFARAEPSRSRQFGGSGLGLSVVRAIAEAHQGEARYRPATSGGSIFEIAIPITKTELTHSDSC
ncbi:MAG: ATP-binding protein [Pseudomonadota bacterium]